MSIFNRINDALTRRLKEQVDKGKGRGGNTDQTRTIGTRSTLNGRPVYWSGQNYGWQTKASHEQLKNDGAFRHGQQNLQRIGNDISTTAGRAWNSAPKPVRDTAVGVAKAAKKELWDNQPEDIKRGVRATVRTADKGLEAVSRATNTSRFITDEAVTAALTLGAGVAVKHGGKTLGRIGQAVTRRIDDVPVPVTRQSAGRGIQNRIQRRLQQNDNARRLREAGAVNPTGRGFGSQAVDDLPAADRAVRNRLTRNTTNPPKAPEVETPKTAGRLPNPDRRSQVTTDQWGRTRVSGNKTDLIFRDGKNEARKPYTRATAEVIANSGDDVTLTRAFNAARERAATYGESNAGRRPKSIVPSIRPKANATGELIPNRSTGSIGRTTPNNRIKSAAERKRSLKAAAAQQRAARRSDIPSRPADAPDGGFASDPKGTGMVSYSTKRPYDRATKEKIARYIYNKELIGRTYDIPEYKGHQVIIGDGEMVYRGGGQIDPEMRQQIMPQLDAISKDIQKGDRLMNLASGRNRLHKALRAAAGDFDDAKVAEARRLQLKRHRIGERLKIARDRREQGYLQGFLDRGEDMSYDGLPPKSKRAKTPGYEALQGDVKNPNRETIRIPAQNITQAAPPFENMPGHTKPFTKKYQDASRAQGLKPTEPKEFFEGMIPDGGSRHVYDTDNVLYFHDLTPRGYAQSSSNRPPEMGGYKFGRYRLQYDHFEGAERIKDALIDKRNRKLGALKQGEEAVYTAAYRDPEIKKLFKPYMSKEDWKEVRKAIKEHNDYGNRIQRILDQKQKVQQEVSDAINSRSAIPERVKAGSKIDPSTRKRRNDVAEATVAKRHEAADKAIAQNPKMRKRSDGTLIDRTLPGWDPTYTSDAKKLIPQKQKAIAAGRDWNIYEPGELENPTLETARKLKAEKGLRNFIAQQYGGGQGFVGTTAIDYESYVQLIQKRLGEATAPVQYQPAKDLPDNLKPVPLDKPVKKGSKITRSEQTARNDLQRNLELPQELNVVQGSKTGSFNAKSRVQDRFTRRLEQQAAKANITPATRRRPNPSNSGRAVKGAHFDKQNISYKDTEANQAARKTNQRIRQRLKTLRYQEQFDAEFPQLDPNAAREAYSKVYPEGVKLGGKRTAGAAGKQGVKNQFRDARNRRGHGDTRVRRTGKWTDSLGRSTDVITLIDEQVQKLNKKFTRAGQLLNGLNQPKPNRNRIRQRVQARSKRR
jgi:hypothetical protein